MILGVGLDIAEVSRLGAIRGRHGDRFLRRVFTPGERAACEGRADSDRAFAARFAAKEAAMKALGTGWDRGVGWKDLEVGGGGGTAPTLTLTGGAAEHAARRGVRWIHLSLTHDAGVAAAVVVLEGEESDDDCRVDRPRDAGAGPPHDRRPGGAGPGADGGGR